MGLRKWVAGMALLFCSAAAAAQSGCDVAAAKPQFISVDRRIVGQGGRGPACTSGAVFTVRLKRDVRFWFDKTLASTSQRLRNGDLIVRYNCSGAGSQNVYVEADDGNHKRQSQRLGVNFCG